MNDRTPNVLFYFVDNLGYGELGCYGGGELRGAATARIDAFAQEGMRLTNFAPEAQCTPSRSALMTGRHAIRSGTHSVTYSAPIGIVAWERTMGDILSDAGYTSAVYGKWHIGNQPGTWPTDHGFDEFYGPPGTYDEVMWEHDPWYVPERDGVGYLLESCKDETPREVKRLTHETKRELGREIVDRSKRFISDAVSAEKPFFVHLNHPLLHAPCEPSAEFDGRSGNGRWADCLLELDGHFGELLDHLESEGVADNTVVVLFGDNGNEDILTDRGTGGYWEGSYFAGMEASLRTPFIVRYPGVVPAGRSSNEVVHITDVFTTLVGWAGCDLPSDRVIDGVDQRAFFEGTSEESARDGFMFWNGDVLYGVKWHHFKMALVDQKYFWDAPVPRAFPRLINLLVDPKEREPYNQDFGHSWTMRHFAQILNEFEQSVAREPLIPMGAPLNHIPGEDG
ncbi:MAG: sulfatase-like hydrolase/transferase [Actinomycetia bacterium]|nr:sulfatase-like hydrolase/transferase [Actinomycetes bacterium]